MELEIPPVIIFSLYQFPSLFHLVVVVVVVVVLDAAVSVPGEDGLERDALVLATLLIVPLKLFPVFEVLLLQNTQTKRAMAVGPLCRSHG